MKFSPYCLLLPAAALFAMSSCVDPSMGGGYSNTGGGYNRGPSPSSYYYQGRSFSGGQYQTGRYNYQGRSYTSRYYHNGQYYYGGQHQNHGSSSSNYQRSSSSYQRPSSSYPRPSSNYQPSSHRDHDHDRDRRDNDHRDNDHRDHDRDRSNSRYDGRSQTQGSNWFSTQSQGR